VPVVTAPSDQTNPAIVPDGSGGTIIAWEDQRNGGSIYAQHVLNDGSVDPSWPVNGSLLASGTTSAFVPAVVIDGAGGAIVFWEDPTTHIFAQRIRSNGVPDPAWGGSGVTVATTAVASKLLNAISDRAGGAFVVWKDSRNGTSNTDIYAMHLTGAGVDPAWPANGLAVCNAALVQQAPVLCTDGSSGAIAVWADRRTAANDYDLYAQHILINGTVDPGWPANGTAVVTRVAGQRLYSTSNIFYIDMESSDNQAEAVIPDGSGGCLITWTDGNTAASQDIYVHHLLSNGAVDPTWTAGGVAVCTDPAPQGLSYMVSDGSGGATVFWADGRNGVAADLSQDLYAQHVLSTGAFTGPMNGMAVLTGGTGSFPRGIRDGGAGLTIFWMDRRDSLTNGYDAYAQHVVIRPNLAVDPSWPIGGFLVSNAASDQFSPSGAWIGGSAAILTWQDRRNVASTGEDVYANRLAIPVTSVGPDLPAPFELGVIAPNPSHDGMRISFSLSRAVSVRVDVFDLSGRHVRTIVSGMHSPGRHDVTWDGTGAERASVGAGVYLVSMRADGFRATRRAMLLR